jgi:hypothetical protein
MKQQINDMQQKLNTNTNEYQAITNERANSGERSTKI